MKMAMKLLALVACGTLITSCENSSQTESGVADLIIRNARIVDGTGSPWTRGDVAIRDGRILAMGPTVDIEATEHTVPGLVEALEGFYAREKLGAVSVAGESNAR